MTNNGSTRRLDRVTAAEFALVTLIWGSTWLVIKGQLGVVPPVWSVAYRFTLSAIVLIFFAVTTGRWRWLTPRGHAFALLVGVAQFALNFNLVYAAEQRLASGPVALVFALLVVPNTVLAAIFLKTRITLRFLAGASIGIGGLVLLFGPDLAMPGATGGVAAGLALVGTAVLCASLGNVVQASGFARSLPALPALATAMVYGAIADTSFAAVTAGWPVVDPRPEYWVGLLYLALLGSVVAFSVYYRLIRRIGPGPAAYTSVVVPVLALFLSTLFENYRWTLLSMAGAVLALVGLAIALGGRAVTRGTPAGRRESPEIAE